MTESSTDSPSVRFWPWLVAIAALGLAGRVGYIIVFSSRLNFGLDSVWYQLEGGALASGHGYVDPQHLFESGRDVATAFRPPLYPGLLAVVVRWIGESRQTLQLAGVVTGTVSIVAIGVLGRRVGGSRVGIVAAALAAVSPALIGFDASLMSETLYVPIVAGLLLMTYVAIDRPTPLRWIGVGALCGLGALTRGDAVVLFAVLVIPSILVLRRPWKFRMLFVAAALAGVALLVGPWLARNQSELGRPTLATLDAGTALAGTNCPAVYEGPLLGFWDHECTVRANDARVSEVERNDRLQRDGLKYAFNHVSRWPVVVPVRVLRLWGLWDPITQARLESIESRNSSWQVITWVAHLLLTGCAVAGFVLMARRRRRWLPLAATLASVTLAAALSYGKQRFLAAAEPALLVAGAFSVVAICDRPETVRPFLHRMRCCIHDVRGLRPPRRSRSSATDGPRSRRRARRGSDRRSVHVRVHGGAG